MQSRALVVLAMLISACSAPVSESTPPVATDPPTTTSTPVATTTPEALTTTSAPATTTTSPFARPDWLGTRLLPLRPDGHGEAQPTPPELVNRQLETPDVLGTAVSNDFDASIEPIPLDVLARSSLSEDCPVTIDDLRYLTMTHIG